MNCDTNALLDAARCFRCIPFGSQAPVHLYLLCQWANAPTCQSSFIAPIPDPIARNNFTGALGFDFTLLQDITISRFGRKFSAQNVSNHAINLWLTVPQTLIASGTVLAASASDSNGFKWVDIAPVTLDKTKHYRIASDEVSQGDLWKDEWTPTGVLDAVQFPVIFTVFTATPSAFPNSTITPGAMFNTCAMCFTP